MRGAVIRISLYARIGIIYFALSAHSFVSSRTKPKIFESDKLRAEKHTRSEKSGETEASRCQSENDL